MPENKKVTKAKGDKIGLDGEKLWEVASGSPSGSNSAPDLTDMGQLGKAPPIPDTSLLKVTDGLKKAAIEPEGAAALNPIKEVNVVEMVKEDLYVSEADRITDTLIKNTRATGELSKWVPEMTFVTGCMNPDHVMSERLDKGLFSISGTTLANMSVKQTMDWMDGPGSKIKGCGYGGCDVTLSKAMGHHLS